MEELSEALESATSDWEREIASEREQRERTDMIGVALSVAAIALGLVSIIIVVLRKTER